MTNSEHYIKLENMMRSGPIVQLTGAEITVKKGEADLLQL